MLPPATEPSIRELIGRCLTRDPRNRLQAIGEARIAIDRAVRPRPPSGFDAPALSPTDVAAAGGERTQRRARLAWTIAAVAMAVIGALAVPALRYLLTPQADRPKETWQVVTPPASFSSSFAISPDGLRLVYSASVAGKVQLWIRPISGLTAQPLVGTDGAVSPFWKPDGQAIGFFADGKLKWIPAEGGPITTLAPVKNPMGGSWNQNGDILFAPHVTEQLWRVSSNSAKPPVAVTTLASSQAGHTAPHFLPDGQHFLYWATGTGENRGLYVGALGTPEAKRLISTADDSAALYAPPGFLLFARQGKLVAQRFDLKTLALTGETFVVAEPPSFNGGVFTCSAATGTLAYRAGSGTERQLAWVDRSGKLLGLVGEASAAPALGLNLSPDGTRLAVGRPTEGNWDIVLLETGRSAATRLTDDPGWDIYPVWSPDGHRVAFWSTRQTGPGIWGRAASGAEAETLVLPSTRDVFSPQDWSSDGRSLLYVTVDPETGADLWALPMTTTGDRRPFPVVKTAFNERDGQFSPDGHWVAYSSNRLGRIEIYMQPFPGTGGATSVSTAGGTQPRWRSDGKELFYIGPDNWMMGVPILGSNGQSVRMGTSTRLFPMASRSPAQAFLYAVAKGGQRFLIEQANERGTATLTVVRNWQPADK